MLRTSTEYESYSRRIVVSSVRIHVHDVLSSTRSRERERYVCDIRCSGVRDLSFLFLFLLEIHHQLQRRYPRAASIGSTLRLPLLLVRRASPDAHLLHLSSRRVEAMLVTLCLRRGRWVPPPAGCPRLSVISRGVVHVRVTRVISISHRELLARCGTLR